MDSPVEYAEVWKRRYAELLGHGLPEEKAKQLATELAAAAVLASAKGSRDAKSQSMDTGSARPAPALKVAKFDGYGLLVMGIPSIIISCFTGSWSGIAIGAVVAGCGFLELDGFRRFNGGLTGARPRLMGSQILLIALAWAYAALSLLHPEPLSPEITDLLKESGDSQSDLLALVSRIRLMVAAAICGITLLYQGSLAFYYWSKTRGSK